MPEVKLNIGGRSFTVACQAGEEENLTQAASLLDAEAETLEKAIGRVPEARMLLMAGLMLADRTVELAQRAARAERQLADGATEDAAAARGEAAAAIAALERATKRIEDLASN